MLQALYAKTPSESKLVTLAFGNVASGSLSVPVITKSVLIGTDPSAVGLTVGAGTVSGTNVQALVAAGLNDRTYELLCTVNDSGGQVHQVEASLTVTTDAA